jgi:hypothetical protein
MVGFMRKGNTVGHPKNAMPGAMRQAPGQILLLDVVLLLVFEGTRMNMKDAAESAAKLADKPIN